MVFVLKTMIRNIESSVRDMASQLVDTGMVQLPTGNNAPPPSENNAPPPSGNNAPPSGKNGDEDEEAFWRTPACTIRQ